MRVSGLASGIDTESLIKQLMGAQRAPVNRMLQQKQLVEWQRDAYREMNTMLTDFRNNKLSDYRLRSTFTGYQVNITGNTAAVSAKVNGSVQGQALTVKVNSLATAASKWGSENIRSSTDFDATKSLKSQVSALAGGSFFNGEVSGAEYSFSINGKEVTVKSSDSMSNIIRRINDNTDVTAFMDEATGKLSFKANQTGLIGAEKHEHIQFEDHDDFLKDVFRLELSSVETSDPNALPPPDEGMTAIKAQDASVVINGLETTRSSNTFTVNGIEVTMLEAGGAESIIGTVRDTDKIFEAITSFVKDYNEVLETINAKLVEAKNRDYQPLTDEQKEDMKESEIEKWEIAAKSGLLRSDQILSSAVDSMRHITSLQVEIEDGVFLSLAEIGITTSTWQEKGKLHIDEDALRAAIAANPDGVTTLFTKASDDNTIGSSRTVSDQGFGMALFWDMKSPIDKLTERAGSPLSNSSNNFIGKQLERMNEDIDRANERLKLLEERYYRQFAAMEAAISRFNSQSASLASMFGMD